MSKDVAAFLLLIVTFAAPVFADSVVDFQEIAAGNFSAVTSHGFNFFNPIFGFGILSALQSANRRIR